MRKKGKPWYSLKLIVPLAIVVPPVGLLLLWRSPRKRFAKIALTVVLVLLLSGSMAVAVQMGLHEKLRERGEPLIGFEVAVDKRGNYVDKRIYPLERKIFNEVVEELRTLRTVHGLSDSRQVSPDALAFERVAIQNNMSIRDVRAIYMKVSIQLRR